MKPTCLLLLPVVLGAGIACARGLRLPAELESITPKSNIEAIVDLYNGGTASAALFAAGVSSVCGTPIVNARSMWGN
jgi:hypothetical protein